MRLSLARAAHLLAALAILNACGGGDSPGGPDRVPTTIDVVTPGASAAGAAVAGLTFVVKDQDGSPMANVPVTVAVTAGGGSLTGAPTRTSSGATSVGVWTLGETVGTNSLTITVGGLTPRIVSVSSVAGAPASVVVVSGNNQTEYAGRVPPLPVRFVVRDQFGNTILGQVLSFSTSGGGTLSSATSTADAAGVVTAPAWTLGKSVVPQRLRATVGGVTGTANAIVQTQFDVTVQFFGTPLSPDQEEWFTAAAARIGALVTGDLPGVNVTGLNAEDFCEVPGLPTSMSGIIDDVVIFAAIRTMDGPGQVLAEAGPCAVRNTTIPLPVIGIMIFDAADIATLSAGGNMQSVIVHEMMHVLGVGTYWSAMQQLNGAGTASVSYNGAEGIANCQVVGGTSICATSVPVENTGGAGTRDAHWRESVFINELMTGYLNAGSNPISRLTIGSFADLGYEVNYDAADVYRIPGTGPTFGSSSLRLAAPDIITAAGWERPHRIGARITQSGEVQRVPVQP